MSQLTGFIPYLIYDLVCRMMPGAVLIAMYRRCWIDKADKGVEIFILALGMWAVGMTLDVATAAFRRSKAVCAIFRYFGFDGDFNRKLGGSIYKVHEVCRVSIFRAMADVTFFRSMLVISVIGLGHSIIWWVISDNIPIKHEWFMDYWLAFALAMPVLLLCWVSRWKEADEEKTNVRDHEGTAQQD